MVVHQSITSVRPVTQYINHASSGFCQPHPDIVIIGTSDIAGIRWVQSILQYRTVTYIYVDTHYTITIIIIMKYYRAGRNGNSFS